MTSDSWPDYMTLHFGGNEFKFEKLRKNLSPWINFSTVRIHRLLGK
jgi:hypothetical protein